MKQVAGGQPTGQLALDIDAFRIDDVGYANHGGGRQGGFVHPPKDHGMAVTVDQAWRQVSAFAFHDLATLGSFAFQVRAKGGDLSVFHQ